MRKWLGAVFIVVATVLTGCGGGGGGGGSGVGFGAGFGASPGTGATAQKIIIDSDYNTMSDDGQLGVMAAQLQAQGKVRSWASAWSRATSGSGRAWPTRSCR